MTDLDRYRTNRQDEIDSACVYRAMAASEADARLAGVYTRLADVEERHAAIWEQQIEKLGGRVRPRRPSLRARILVLLGRRLGARFLLPTVTTLEQQNQHGYDRQPESTQLMRGQERSHARVLAQIAGDGGMAGPTVARMEGRHRRVGGNALRAAVLGANDGLVSNLSLVMGVTGAAMSERAVFATGLAGLLAGACSMAMGEWISVQSSRELYERQIAVEQAEIATLPDEEEEELALIYMAKGLPDDEAKRVANRIMADQATALDAMAREELGFDPAELGGSPWVAAATSFLLFAIGAVVPVLPFALFGRGTAIGVSLAASAAMLFAIGFAITLFTGRGVVRTGLRQLAFGLGAAGVTYGIGHLIGVAL